MTLIDVVKKNVKHNFQHYFLYVASMTFSILIYFTFVSLQYNKQIANAFDQTDKIQPAFFASSFILLLFVTIFIWYSNAFFIKKRKQEIGLYSLLGVEKTDIGRMLFYENFILGVIALIIGIALGELFSIFFSMILVKLMGFSMVVHFSFNSTAIIQTLIVFSIITFLTSLQGYLIMHRFQLIDLFRAKNKGETLSKPSIIIALLSLIFIGVSYWMFLTAADSKSWDQHFGRNLLITLVIMIIGSYFFFHSLSGFFVQMLQNKKSIYYKWANLLTFTQLTNRLKSNAIMLTTISILNGVTLIAFGFAYTMYYNTLNTMKDFVPYSYQYEITSDEIDQQITALIQNNKEYPLLFDETFDYLMVKGDTASLKNIPGGYLYYEEQFAVVSESSYNQLAKSLEREPLPSLNESEAVMLEKNFIGSQNKEKSTEQPVSLSLANEDISLMIKESKIEVLFNNDIQPATLIVSDSMFKTLQKEHKTISSHVFKVEDEEQSATLTKKVKELVAPYTAFYSFSDSYQTAQSVYGLLIFIGGFLGLVFLSATGSIIYFKMLTEAAEDRQRYTTLRNVGMSKWEVKRVIAKQYMIIFLLPLIVGIAHSSIMLWSLSKLMDMNFITPVIIINIVYAILYGSYYIMTVGTANKLVNNS
ncbi:ABC transporter permease [Bacillus sp. FJAT-52991]|uniref:ABC transporter permease n=1 Tax=Bacillus kandeliae TaxID=3129297 RepID=A0ABZ2N5K0_9BACI